MRVAERLAYGLVTDHPYAAVSDSDGDFRIRKLAYGEYEFRVWHEAVGFLNAGMTIKVRADNIELAPIMLLESMLNGSRVAPKAKPAAAVAPNLGNGK